MSFTVAQIDAQTKTFEQAYRSGKITSAQYQQAMRAQSANRAAALKREQQSPTSAPTSNAATTLPKSNYWTTAPSPSKPSVLNVSEAQLTQAGGTKITPPSGYIVTNMQPTVVEEAGIRKEAVSYELQEKPKPVQQSDLGIGAQLLIAADVFGKFVEAKTKDNTVINQLVKAETKMALQPILNFEAGAVNALETEAYGTASLAKSVVSSISQKQLVYTPVKTPQLGPTVVGGGIGLVTGSGEAQRMNEMPFGYMQGSLFGEVGVSLISGMAIGAAAGKTSSFVKTVVNPRINRAAESALARSTRLFEAGANKIEPGLGKATELVVSRKAAAIGTKLDLVEAKAGASLTGKLVSPVKYGVKYGVVEPVKAKVSLVGERVASSQVVSKASGVARRVVPDLKVYSKMVTGKYADDLVPQSFKDVRLASEPFREAPKNLVKGIKETGMYQSASYVKSVQAPNTEMAKLLRAVPKSSLDDLTLKSALRAEQKLVNPAVTKGVSKVAVTKPYVSKELGNIGSLTTVKTKTSTPLSKVVSDIEKSASNIKASIGTRQVAMQIGIDAKPQVLTKVKPISFKSTKNIGTFEALQMSKQVAKQGKRLTQLVPYTSTVLPSISKPAIEVKQVVTQIQKASAKQTKEIRIVSGVPTLAPAYPGTQRQRVREEYELVTVSYPKTTGKRDSLMPSFVPSFTPEIAPRIEPAVKILPDQRVIPRVLPNIRPQIDTRITPSFVPALVQPELLKEAQKVTPRTHPVFGKPSKGRLISPNLGLGGGGGGRGSGDALTGKWHKYKNPIKTPKQMFKDFSSFGGGKSRGKQAFGGMGLSVSKTNLVSINANMFKQPRKRYNKVKQRRSSKR